MSYFRVIPRDLFNEAKLLKGLGKISLMIHDGELPELNMNHEDESQGFTIEQDGATGAIYVSNIHVFDNNGTPVELFHPLNCKANWSLMMRYKDEDYYCFDESGNFMPSRSIFR